MLTTGRIPAGVKPAFPNDEEMDAIEALGGTGACIDDGAEFLGSSVGEAAEVETEGEEEEEPARARQAHELIPRGQVIPVAEIPELVSAAKLRKSGDRAIAARGMQALERLIVGLRPKLFKEAKALGQGGSYGRERVRFDDLVMEGVAGVIEAVDDYTVGHVSGKGFIPYAVSYHVLPKMRAWLTQMTKPVTMPQRTATRVLHATRVAAEIQANGNEVSTSDLAAQTGMSLRTLELGLAATQDGVSLDAPIGGPEEDGADTRSLLESLVVEDSGGMDGLAQQDLGALLDQLDEVTRLVLEGYCGLYGETYEKDYRAVAELVTSRTGTEISHTTAWRIYDEAIGALRKVLQQDLDADLRTGNQVLTVLWPDERRAVLSYYGFYGVARAESFSAMSKMFREGKKQCSDSDAKELFQRAHTRLVREFPEVAAQLRPICERRLGRKLAAGELNRETAWRPITDEAMRSSLRRSLQIELFATVRAEIIQTRAQLEATALGISVEELHRMRDSQLSQMGRLGDGSREEAVQLSMF